MPRTELNITGDQTDIFNELYEKNKYTHDEINKLCEKLFRLNGIDSTTVTINTPFADLDLTDDSIYDQNFKEFIESCNKIFDDSRISPESKFIKINSSFKNNCYSNDFKNKFKLYLLQLRYICCYNHLILNKKLLDVILKNIKLLGNCDSELIDKYTTQEVRGFASTVATTASSIAKKAWNAAPRAPISQETRQTITSKVKSARDELQHFIIDLQNKGVEAIMDTSKVKRVDLPPTQILNIPIDLDIKEDDKSNQDDKSLTQSDKLRLLRLKTRNNFNTLSDLYQIGFVSSCDVANSVDHLKKIDTAIDLNNTKISLKNSFNTELAYYKARVAGGDHDIISNTLRSLGVGLAPVSLGFSIVATNVISYILEEFFKTNYVKSLKESKENLDAFRKKLNKFILYYAKKGKLINLDTIENCTLQSGTANNLFYTASQIQEEFFTQTYNNYDKFLIKYNNFIYVYNLICDKTQQEIFKFIKCGDNCDDADTPANAPADTPANADAPAPAPANALADADAPPAVNAVDDYETKINKLYTVLEHEGCLTRYSTSQKFYMDKSEDEKKEILRTMFQKSTEDIPIPIRCGKQQISALFQNFIEPVLSEKYTDYNTIIRNPATTTTLYGRKVVPPVRFNGSGGKRKTRKLRKNKTRKQNKQIKSYRKRHTRRR